MKGKQKLIKFTCLAYRSSRFKK